MQIYVGYWGDFVFGHVREMKNMVLPVLCRNLAVIVWDSFRMNSTFDLEESLWKAMIVSLTGHQQHT